MPASPPPVPESPVQMLLDTLNLVDPGARTDEDIFVGPSHWMPLGRVYGGQVMAQAVAAAQRTVEHDRPIHSAHAYFLRPGDITEPITFAVSRIHDGRSFSTRRAQAYQKGVPILSGIASFQVPSGGAELAAPMPEGLPSADELAPIQSYLPDVDHPVVRHWAEGRPFDIRYVEHPVYLDNPGRDTSDTVHVWMRTKETLPDNDALHRAALAYMSDYAMMEPILRVHGASWSTKGIKVASLDHAVWWHRPVRVDEWMLVQFTTSFSGSGRGLASAKIWSHDGRHVASVAQEGMVRLPEESEQ